MKPTGPLSQPQAQLRGWLSRSAFQGSPTLLASYMGVSLATVKGWLYEGKTPRPKQRILLYLLSGLDEFAPSDSESDLLCSIEAQWHEQISLRARRLRSCVSELWSLLEFFILTPGSDSFLCQEIRPEDMRTIARMFERFADPKQFAAWEMLRAVQRYLDTGSRE